MHLYVIWNKISQDILYHRPVSKYWLKEETEHVHHGRGCWDVKVNLNTTQLFDFWIAPAAG